MIEMLHTNCMDYMATLPDKAFDLAIVDPPYGGGGNAQWDAKAARIKELETALQSICKECEIKNVFSDECAKCNVKLALEGRK